MAGHELQPALFSFSRTQICLRKLRLYVVGLKLHQQTVRSVPTGKACAIHTVLSLDPVPVFENKSVCQSVGQPAAPMDQTSVEPRADMVLADRAEADPL